MSLSRVRCRPPWRALALASIAAFAVGCGNETKGLDWTIAFADDALRMRAHAVEAWIAPETCDVTEPGHGIWNADIRPGDVMGVTPPVLEPGTYAFAARARDVDCMWYAQGCETVELGGADSPTEVRTVMEALAASMSSCGSVACVMGECDFPDAGPMDAGPVVVDDGGMDSGVVVGDDAAVDAGFDAGFDARPPDACVSSGPETCNGMDEDCDGLIDEGVIMTFYRDADDDTYGDMSMTMTGCTMPGGHVARAGDCDDSDPARNPGETEACNGIDDDCDGTADPAETSICTAPGRCRQESGGAWRCAFPLACAAEPCCSGTGCPGSEMCTHVSFPAASCPAQCTVGANSCSSCHMCIQ